MNSIADIHNKYEKKLHEIIPIDWTIKIDRSYRLEEKFEVLNYTVFTGPTFISSFKMVPMIGCCGIMVSTEVNIAYRYRKLGIGGILNEMRKETATSLGYTILLCTDVATNEPQQRILAKNGWKKIFSFVNKRTNNPVNIHVIEL